METNQAIKAIEKCLFDMVLEEQAKLGYSSEVIRLYYPLSSLCNVIGEEITMTDMTSLLGEFSEHMHSVRRDVEVTSDGLRYCFKLSKEFSEYVHENSDENEFTYKIVELMKQHSVKIEDILMLFKKENKKFVAKKIENSEFDLLLYFTEGDDRYYYCFKDEKAHVIYHRFLPGDYKEMYEDN